MPASNRRIAVEKDESEMKSIGKYQVIEDLGGSATGKTFRVRDAFRNREFAVKILQTVPGLSAEAKEQFCAHLAACAELTHRHIAKVHDLGEVEEGIFIATEWRSGTDLRRFMDDNQDLPLGQKLAVIAQVAEGLSFAHSRGIAHGNLKPSNIFVDASRDDSSLTWNRQVAGGAAGCGQPARGVDGELSRPRASIGAALRPPLRIFALGVMLYEFASGKHPFAADPGLIPREIVHSEPVPLRNLDPQVPEELERLVARSLNKNPAERLQTAEEFASGLYLAAQQLRRLAAAVVPTHPQWNPSLTSRAWNISGLPRRRSQSLISQSLLSQLFPTQSFQNQWEPFPRPRSARGRKTPNRSAGPGPRARMRPTPRFRRYLAPIS